MLPVAHTPPQSVDVPRGIDPSESGSDTDPDEHTGAHGPIIPALHPMEAPAQLALPPEPVQEPLPPPDESPSELSTSDEDDNLPRARPRRSKRTNKGTLPVWLGSEWSLE